MDRGQGLPPWAMRAAGLGALFSGAALLTYIFWGFSLVLALVLAAFLLAAGAYFVWRRATPPQRLLLRRLVVAGAAAGFLATIAYDVTRFLLSQLDPSPYNPFEAVRIFGVALTGQSSGDAVHYIAGTLFHFLNGTAFGVAYAVIFRRHGVLIGIAWGVFLELFQLALYPGWLNIKFVDEFVQISALSHVAYGAVLGYLCRLLFRRSGGAVVRGSSAVS